MSFSGRVTWRDIYTSKCSCDTAAVRTLQLRIQTRNIFDVSMLQLTLENIA